MWQFVGTSFEWKILVRVTFFINFLIINDNKITRRYIRWKGAEISGITHAMSLQSFIKMLQAPLMSILMTHVEQSPTHVEVQMDYRENYLRFVDIYILNIFPMWIDNNFFMIEIHRIRNHRCTFDRFDVIDQIDFYVSIEDNYMLDLILYRFNRVWSIILLDRFVLFNRTVN